MTAADRFGHDVFREVSAALVVEESGWAPELVQRATDRINRERSGPAMRAVVVWPAVPGFALTLPGRYLYLGRELLSRGLGEAGIAFVIAHEMAHHDLGHLDRSNEWLNAMDRLSGLIPALVAMAARVVESIRYQPEIELAADRRALELCRAAGYGDEGARETFDLFERILLDQGDLDQALGDERPGWGKSELVDILLRTGHTHPPLVERRQALFDESTDALVVRQGVAAAIMVMACVRCAIRFPPSKRCPRCGGRSLHDLRLGSDRSRLLSAVHSRRISLPGSWSLSLPSAATAASLVGFFLYLLVTGVGLVDALAGAFLVSVIVLLCVSIGSWIWRESVGEWVLSRRLAVLEPVPAAPALPGPSTTVRGRVHVVKSVKAPISGRPCAAWRVVGDGPAGAIDDAGVGRFELLDGRGRPRPGGGRRGVLGPPDLRAAGDRPAHPGDPRIPAPAGLHGRPSSVLTRRGDRGGGRRGRGERCRRDRDGQRRAARLGRGRGLRLVAGHPGDPSGLTMHRPRRTLGLACRAIAGGHRRTPRPTRP